MISSLALAFAATTSAAPAITVDSILREMTDLSLLAQRPDPWYRYKQWTSYDRASDNWKEPFANGDAGQFIRTEQIEGRKERVMADVKGPGALVRLWSANPVGTVRFYFDGETKPRLETAMEPLLSGKNPMFPETFSYMASSGANLYFPMPFAKSLKITWEGDPKVAIYYAAGIREYVPGTRVTTFVPGQLAESQKAMADTARLLYMSRPVVAPNRKTTIRAGESTELNFTSDNGSELRDFVAKVNLPDDATKPWDDPSRRHNLIRKLRLCMTFDSEKTVDVPLGDFFGSALGATPFKSLPLSVTRDGLMVARWSMPYRKKAQIRVINENGQDVDVAIGATSVKRPFTENTYLFHARWNVNSKQTRPMYDFTYADVKGEGRFVGVGLAVSNPVPAWWGEGDEKVYVDGEKFPSLFGTGTEDYFGYAWCNPAPFERPYHAQPPTPNQGNFGQTQNSRYHIVDDIPFEKGIKFDMEAWHWADVKCTYATTAYWYARPGTTLPEVPNMGQILIPETPMPKPVEGALEGESLKWAVSGGATEIQSGFFELSGQKQFWWRNSNPGAVATTKIRVPAAGRYELVGHFGYARDYGRFAVSVGGNPAKELDFFQDALEWKKVSLGTFDLPAGETTLKFQTLTANPKSEPGANMLGADYFLLVKK